LDKPLRPSLLGATLGLSGTVAGLGWRLEIPLDCPANAGHLVDSQNSRIVYANIGVHLPAAYCKRGLGLALGARLAVIGKRQGGERISRRNP